MKGSGCFWLALGFILHLVLHEFRYNPRVELLETKVKTLEGGPLDTPTSENHT